MLKNSLMNSLFGLLPTFFFDSPSASSAADGRENSQLTGVARYLQ